MERHEPSAEKKIANIFDIIDIWHKADGGQKVPLELCSYYRSYLWCEDLTLKA